MQTNTNFPLRIQFPSGVDKAALYSSNRQLLWIVMNWGKQMSAPAFTNMQAGSLDISEDSSSIDYQGTTYTILSATITRPSHSSWVLPDLNIQENTLDLFVIFKSLDSSSETRYIFAVLPILSNSSVSDPSYLSGLTGTQTGPFSLGDLLPPNGKRDFGFYSTHFNVVGGEFKTNALTLVFYNGIGVTPATLQKLKETANFSDTILPTELSGYEPLNINSIDMFPTLASVSTYTTPLSSRTDLTKAYKCLPLDPDADISEGKIQFDPKSSKIIPLNEIIDQRDAIRNSEILGAVKKTGSVEQVIAVFLGILLALTLVVFVFFILSEFMGWSLGGFSSIPTYLYVGVGSCFLGYLIGILYRV